MSGKPWSLSYHAGHYRTVVVDIAALFNFDLMPVKLKRATAMPVSAFRKFGWQLDYEI